MPFRHTSFFGRVRGLFLCALCWRVAMFPHRLVEWARQDPLPVKDSCPQSDSTFINSWNSRVGKFLNFEITWPNGEAEEGQQINLLWTRRSPGVGEGQENSGWIAWVSVWSSARVGVLSQKTGENGEKAGNSKSEAVEDRSQRLSWTADVAHWSKEVWVTVGVS